MKVTAACRACGDVTLDADQVHVHSSDRVFGPSATYLCPVCGERRPLSVTAATAAELITRGALLIEQPEELRPGTLGSQHAAELREVLSAGTWFDDVDGPTR